MGLLFGQVIELGKVNGWEILPENPLILANTRSIFLLLESIECLLE
jgi:hypothetical protein